MQRSVTRRLLPVSLLGALTSACGGSKGAPVQAMVDSGSSESPEAGVDAEGSAQAPEGGPAATDAGPDLPEAAGALESGVDGALPTLDARTSAIQKTIATNSLCTGLPAFYWEIGDASGPLVSGAVGTTFSGTTTMEIASASKFVWGAYVVQRFAGNLAGIDLDAMRMMSGYVSLVYDSCVGTSTVSACFMAAKNSTLTAADVGRFDYNGGHFQKYAVDLGLGGDDDQALTADIKAQVGTELAFKYSSPQLAGGITTSAADYAAFLRKILSGGLALHDHLGENAVCTQPSSCPSAVYSPAPAAWHYSYGHWVEDDPMTGDGAFSSPGAFGFYPWIDASKTYYGILARYSLATQAYVESAKCGVEIRRAFMTGQPQ